MELKANWPDKVVSAAEHGQFEVQVMRFPSKLCTDGGRAINNGLPGWERTLPGKAHEAYEVWVRAGRGKGFRLFAKILDYPGGMPGDALPDPAATLATAVVCGSDLCRDERRRSRVPQ